MSILDKFTLVDIVKSRSASVATVYPNGLKLNNPTAAELRFTPYVQVYINAKDKQFAVCACKEDDDQAMPFSKPQGEQKYAIKLNNAAVADAIRKMAGWTDNAAWNIPGVYFAEENVLIYDVATAYAPVAKGGWAAKKAKEAAAAEGAAEMVITEE